jgi:DNA polymerase (family X)
MPQKSILSVFEEIGALLEIEGENSFKVNAYYNAAKTLAGVDDLDTVVQQGRLKEIRGIGEQLSMKITEYYQSGIIAYHEELKKRIPVSLLELAQIPNLGPKKIKVLFDRLGITNAGELEYACRENRLISLAGFGVRSQEKILKGIEFMKRHKGEFLFGDVYPLAFRIKERLNRIAPAEQIAVCGSIRRRKEIVRDIDILVASSQWQQVSRHFTSMPEIEEVMLEGETKTSCRLVSGIEADLRVVSPDAFPCALIYFTGSKEHNVRLRGIAKKRGLKLNEYGLFDGDRHIALADERVVYEYLGLDFITPELREDMGEIEAAQSHGLPDLVDLPDLKGTFHVHTEMSDGIDSLSAIADFAGNIGLSYIGVADHSRSAYYAGGLKIEDVQRQWEAIDRFNKTCSNFHFFKGIESDILMDGSLDYDDEILSGFDFVIASIHSGFTMNKADMERRILKAIENPYTTILGHPTGRLLLTRDGYDIDMRTIIDAAAEHKVVIEINASPYRLDIDWRFLRYAKEKGVRIAINPDAHSAKGLSEIFYGVGIARKGWLERDDILNTGDTGEIEMFLTQRKHEKGR